MIASASAERPMSPTKDRSSFSLSKGSGEDRTATRSGAEVVERDADARLPKGVERAHVLLAVAHQHRFGDLEFQPRRCGARAAERLHDRSGRVSSRNWTADTLTATVTPAGQAAASRQAVSSTQSPIGTIRPVSSASGMNSAGDTSPRSGCRQRRRASTRRPRPTRGRGSAGRRGEARPAPERRRDPASCSGAPGPRSNIGASNARIAPRPSSLAR